MTVKEVLYLIVFGLLFGLAVLGVKHVKDWYDLKEVAETATAIGQASSGIIEDSAKADEDRSNVDYAVGQGRDAFRQSYQGAKANEPEVADHASRAVPLSVRRAFRERRLARERSGCAGGECKEGLETSPPSER